MPPPTIRLAVPSWEQDAGLSAPPGLLVSYYYFKGFADPARRAPYRDWVMDSGAYSAHQVGADIDLDAYTEKAKELLATDKTLSEVYALDVIGDWRASLKNTERMWAAGVPAIPCFHANEPWDVLVGLARDYPKIALGGVALANASLKLKWAQQCFARVWPKKIHGFAYGSDTYILALPFHSVDSANWAVGPLTFQKWAAFRQNGMRWADLPRWYTSMKGRSKEVMLKAEIEYYLGLERQATSRWRNAMAELEAAA